jgi:hypothetical protein
MFAGERPPVATWYRRGWNKWKLRRSTSVTSTATSLSPRVTANPPKPPPTITTFMHPLCDREADRLTGTVAEVS